MIGFKSVQVLRSGLHWCKPWINQFRSRNSHRICAVKNHNHQGHPFSSRKPQNIIAKLEWMNGLSGSQRYHTMLCCAYRYAFLFKEIHPGRQMKLLSLIPGLGDIEAYTQMYSQTGEQIKYCAFLRGSIFVIYYQITGWLIFWPSLLTETSEHIQECQVCLFLYLHCNQALNQLMVSEKETLITCTITLSFHCTHFLFLLCKNIQQLSHF